MIDETLLQVLGRNEEAQEVISSIFDTTFGSSIITVAGQEIIEKYYNWRFPFRYTRDGGGKQIWTNKVQAFARRWQDITGYLDLWGTGATDNEQREEYSGVDTVTYTDSRAEYDRQTFGTVDPTYTAGQANATEHGFLDGKNKTVQETAHGRTRTYTDGRTIPERIAEAMGAHPPLAQFINAFGTLLLPPAEEDII